AHVWMDAAPVLDSGAHATIHRNVAKAPVSAIPTRRSVAAHRAKPARPRLPLNAAPAAVSTAFVIALLLETGASLVWSIVASFPTAVLEMCVHLSDVPGT